MNDTAMRIRERLQAELDNASEGMTEGLRRNDPNMAGANQTRAVAFEEAIKILDEETAKT